MTGAIVLQALYGVGIIAASWVLSGWIAGLFNVALDRGAVDPSIRATLVRAVRPILFFAGLVAAMGVLGLDPAGFLVILAALGLALGLGLQETMARAVSGATLLSGRPFTLGDQIKVDGLSGTVTRLALLTTVIETPDGALVTIPNTLLTNQPLHNLSRLGARRASVRLALPQDARLGDLQGRMARALLSSEGFVPDRGAAVTLSDDSTSLEVQAWTNGDTAKARAMLHDLAQDVLAGRHPDEAETAEPPKRGRKKVTSDS
jgi:small conductance mechanosensitive channel